MATDALLTPKAAAELLHVTDETLRRWADDKRIRHILLPSGQRRYWRSDIEAALTPVEPKPKAG